MLRRLSVDRGANRRAGAGRTSSGIPPMTASLDIQFAPLSAAPAPTVVALAGEELALAPSVRALDERTRGGVMRAAKAAAFTGKARTAIEILAPAGLDAQRLIVAGAGRAGSEQDRLRLGGYAFAQASARKTETASLIADLADTGPASAETVAADLAMGALLRSYTFDKYRTTRRNGNGGAGNGEESDREVRNGLHKLVVHCANPEAAERAFASRRAVVEGVFFARDLVSEPPNVLPESFAERLRDLAKPIGVEVDVIEPAAMERLGMGALLGVAQGIGAAGAAGGDEVERRLVEEGQGRSRSSARASPSTPAAFR